MSTTIFKTLITKQTIAKIFIFTIAIASVATMVFLAGCSARRGTSATIEEGVVINGVRWATRNADGFRAFVSSPEMMGGFYARNTNRARDRYTLRRSLFRRGGSQGNSFLPCPPGWRLPTVEEFESLIATGSVWAEVNGVNGRLFGAAPHQLFLPAAGKFVDISPRVRDVNEMGYYLAGEGRTMIMVFCQENIGISRVHSFVTEGLAPRPRWGAGLTPPERARIITERPVDERGRPFHIGTHEIVPEGLQAITIFPELSVRCVAVTDDE